MDRIPRNTSAKVCRKTRGNWSEQLVHSFCGRPAGVTGESENSGHGARSKRSRIIDSATIIQSTSVARKDPKRKANREGERGTDLLARLDNAGAASVLKTLLARHRELRPEAEAIARDLLTQISLFSVADDVEIALLQYGYDDLNGRAGGHSWGYVEPTEAAWELLEEAVEPFVSEMKRYLEMGLEEQALQFCQGVLLGLYRVRVGQDNEIGRAHV